MAKRKAGGGPGQRWRPGGERPGRQVEVEVLSHPKKSAGSPGPPAQTLSQPCSLLCRPRTFPRKHPLSPKASVSNVDFTESFVGRFSVTHLTAYSSENSSSQSLSPSQPGALFFLSAPGSCWDFPQLPPSLVCQAIRSFPIFYF